jgi:hypothetical protein
MCREQYRKHREKRLAEAAEKYWADPEKSRERSRAMYAKHKEKRAAAAREYRRKRRDEVNAKALARYHANRETILARRKTYDVDIEARRAYFRDRRKNNPEDALIQDAKRALYEQAGIPFRDQPEDLILAKAEQLKIVRAVKTILKAGTEK